ncbi:hypothetical protein EKO04_000162 [Ascochyta lentis]|uniref:Uncharacterized protein n=1 Tax=Ascochyta lentis TaxID=205686 RepID=A0A8H7MN25_9PLEO|nr:hypothetical protein EKO04_000162 [Ascochyta lentis]
MTTVVANSPIPVQYAAPAPADGVGSSRTYDAIAPSTLSPHNLTPTSKHSKLPDHNASPTSSSSDAAMQQQRAEGKRSPLSYVVQSFLSFSFDASPSPFFLFSHLDLPVAAATRCTQSNV